MKYVISFLLLISLFFSTSGIVPWSSKMDIAQAYSGYPTFYIASVVKDKSVTIRTYNFPAHDTFKVLMNDMGTRGLNGIYVDSITTGSGGSFTATFKIPGHFKGDYRIAIRLQSTTGSGYYAYNWFYNNTAKGYNKNVYSYYSATTKGNLYIYVSKVVEDKYVYFTAYNLPKKDAFKIILYKSGSKVSSGEKVGKFSTGIGGTRSFKVSIPSSLKGKSSLRIRIQSLTGSGYYADTWFNN